ncbi:MAG: Uracil-DNA glycosylase, family 4 [Candidatus Jettenia ecosi]|uniref:Type-4 uracil-DNA glycosylase n=1 Tax=Candidatus Jettenia ecosi TaxID=2494326 RepID=A0A533Q8I4_9BACT|nr:MAG: Uracil-DNA glycosylase, family 4 [Candidatus Jettenia ecosi]
MYLDEIKKELASIIGMVKAKIEIEKGFGIDTVTFTNTKVSDAIHQTSPNSFTEIEPTGTPVGAKSIGIQAFMNTKEAKIKLLEELRHEMLVCHKCPLSKTRINLVFGVGNSMADLMFIGEAPGRDEDLQGEPFVGRAGQLLTKIIEAIDMKRSDIYIANILKCRPPGNRNPLPEEIIICIPYLIKQIEIIQPKVLCALGAFAAQALLNTKAPVGTLRGRFHDYKGIPMMVTFHPAYLLRNPNDKAKVWDDMKKVRDFLKNEFK